MIEVATYQIKNTMPPGITIPGWLGYPILNNEILWVRFEGATQEEVIKKANAWYDGESLIARHEIHGGEVHSSPYKKIWGGKRGGGMPYKTSWNSPTGAAARVVADGWGNSMGDDPGETDKPSHGLAGSVWLVHHGLRVKGRFPADKVDAMIAEGYERGGPRTQFKGDGGW